MNWKQEAMDKLQGYEARKSSLESIPQELARLKSAFASLRSTAAQDVCVNGGESRREDALLSNLVLRQELERALEQARLWVEMVERGLGVLNGEERLVLERLYLRPAKGNVERLCEELHVEKTAVYDRREKALRHFTVALYGGMES